MLSSSRGTISLGEHCRLAASGMGFLLATASFVATLAWGWLALHSLVTLTAIDVDLFGMVVFAVACFQVLASKFLAKTVCNYGIHLFLEDSLKNLDGDPALLALVTNLVKEYSLVPHEARLLVRFDHEKGQNIGCVNPKHFLFRLAVESESGRFAKGGDGESPAVKCWAALYCMRSLGAVQAIASSGLVASLHRVISSVRARNTGWRGGAYVFINTLGCTAAAVTSIFTLVTCSAFVVFKGPGLTIAGASLGPLAVLAALVVVALRMRRMFARLRDERRFINVCRSFGLLGTYFGNALPEQDLKQLLHRQELLACCEAAGIFMRHLDEGDEGVERYRKDMGICDNASDEERKRAMLDYLQAAGFFGDLQRVARDEITRAAERLQDARAAARLQDARAAAQLWEDTSLESQPPSSEGISSELDAMWQDQESLKAALVSAARDVVSRRARGC